MLKLGTVSPDLLIKLALVAGAIGLAYYAYKQASAAAGAVAHQVGAVADAIITGTNPVNPENFANRAVSAVGSAIVSNTGPGRSADGSWSPGAWVFDVTHPKWDAQNTAPNNTAPGAQAVYVDAMGNFGTP